MNRIRIRCSTRGLVVVSLGLLASASPASAAMFSAASVSELIAAINAANQNAEPDAIALVAGTTFTLSQVNNSTTTGSTGLPTVTANENLTIFGNGGIIQRSIDMGTPSFRLFDVTAGASLALENLTLQGGLADGRPARGGAIFSQGNLALLGVTVQNNIAQGTPGSSCLVCGGPGGPGGDGLGGGIYSTGSLLLENSTLDNNQARGGAGGAGRSAGGRGGNGAGGGLYAAAGTATLLGSTVTGNVAQGAAGGQGGGPDFTPGAPGQGIGGGIYIANAQVGLDEFTLAHVTFNTASTSDPNIYGPFDTIANPIPVPGDFNSDGTVNAADYVVWRKGLGTVYTQAHYETWRAHFGQTAGSGAAPPSAESLSAAVPEPASFALAVVLVLGLATCTRLRGLIPV